MPGITIISASQTGNARRVAETLRDDLLAAKLNVKLVNAGDYKFKQIASEKLLIVVTSTQGEGEPPEEAVALHKFLFSKKRRSWKTPRLPCLVSAIALMNFSASPGKISIASWRNWAVNACSTVSMPTLNTGAAASEWRARVVDVLKSRAPVAAPSQSVATGAVNEIHTSPYSKDAPLVASLRLTRKLPGVTLKRRSPYRN